MRIAFTTLGCKANWADTESFAQAAANAGFRIVPFEDSADIYVVNTCTVTAVADQQSRQMLRRARRRNARAVVIATGCMGEVSPDSLRRIAGVDRVFGTSDRDDLIKYISELAKTKGCHPRGSGDPAGFPLKACGNDMLHSCKIGLPAGRQSRARAFLKIQDGCSRRCTYCIVPRARGQSRSVPPNDVVDACRELSKFHREIVLTGIDIGQYGVDLGGASLVTLLRRLMGDVDASRFRISTLDPTFIGDEYVNLIASSPRICRHVHLSIQSCSDSVLKRMGRSYGGADVRDAVFRLVRAIPNVAVTGDVIVGFPGEGDGDFEETFNVIAELPMAGLHVFPFSPRAGTRAAGMSGRLQRGTVKARAARLRGLGLKLRRAYLEGQVGGDFDFIVTSRERGEDGSIEAFSDNAVSAAMPPGKIGYAGIGRGRITEIKKQRAFGLWH